MHWGDHTLCMSTKVRLAIGAACLLVVAGVAAAQFLSAQVLQEVRRHESVKVHQALYNEEFAEFEIELDIPAELIPQTVAYLQLENKDLVPVFLAEIAEDRLATKIPVLPNVTKNPLLVLNINNKSAAWLIKGYADRSGPTSEVKPGIEVKGLNLHKIESEAKITRPEGWTDMPQGELVLQFVSDQPSAFAYVDKMEVPEWKFRDKKSFPYYNPEFLLSFREPRFRLTREYLATTDILQCKFSGVEGILVPQTRDAGSATEALGNPAHRFTAGGEVFVFRIITNPRGQVETLEFAEGPSNTVFRLGDQQLVITDQKRQGSLRVESDSVDDALKTAAEIQVHKITEASTFNGTAVVHAQVEGSPYPTDQSAQS